MFTQLIINLTVIRMKAVNFIISIFQVAVVVLYVLFYNVQYFWSLYGTVQNLLNLVAK